MVRANDKVYIVNSLLMFCSLPYFPSCFRLEFFFCFTFRELPFFSLCFRSNRFLIFYQCTWSACGSEVTKRREYDLRASKAPVFFCALFSLSKKSNISVRVASPFFDSGRFRQHFGQAAQFSRESPGFTQLDGSHCTVCVHFEEFVSHSRCQTLAAEL